jgi:hypothetical protein
MVPDGGGGAPEVTGVPVEERSVRDGAAGAAEAVAASAVARYRELVASQPGLVPEMVRGNTPEEIDASAEAARRAYGEISRRVAEEYERQMPVGNPARSAAAAGSAHLSPEAQIALGLRRAGSSG